MDRHKRRTRLTEAEQKEKERLIRSGPPPMRKGTGRVSEEFWELPKPEDPEGLLLKALLEDRREGR